MRIPQHKCRCCKNTFNWYELDHHICAVCSVGAHEHSGFTCKSAPKPKPSKPVYKYGNVKYEPIRCNLCGQVKLANLFTSEGRKVAECRVCRNKRNGGYVDRAMHLKWHYGLSMEDYETMLAAQDERCAICGVQVSGVLFVDHDHKTGRVRGLLCNPCNSGLGLLQDDPNIMRAAIAYLERYRAEASATTALPTLLQSDI